MTCEFWVLNPSSLEEQPVLYLLRHLSSSMRLQHPCHKQLQGVKGMQVDQNPPAQSLQEGTGSALRCNFSMTMRSVQWFRQTSLCSLISLLHLASGTKENGRLKSTFDSKERYSTLNIGDAQLEDSGTYLCLAVAQCSQQS